MRPACEIAALCVLAALSVGAQPSPSPASGRVLELDGKNSAVELPPNIFNDLEQATIEAWVKFRDLSGSRFYSYGGDQQDLCVGRRTPPFSGRDLDVFVAQGNGQVEEVVVSGIIQTDAWYHVAAVLGPGGMELHVNGVLTGTNASSGCFANLKSGGLHFLGRMNGGRADAPQPVFFNGQLAEFRVWKTRRTPREIRENMFRGLTGTEPGLAGLWNFEKVENGVAKDSAPGGHDGKLVGNAKTVEAQLPTSLEPTNLENVLDLPGEGSYVELPPRLFTNQVVTVEGWIKWREFGVYSRFFQFTDSALNIVVMNYSSTSTLCFERFRGPAFDGLVVNEVPDLLKSNQWYHVAVATGTNWSKLYLNGLLISTNEAPRNWMPDPPPPLKNFLGRSIMKGNPMAAADTDLNGQIDEVRIWQGERSEAQIRENMFKSLTGREPGLAALWSFNDGTATDSSTNGHHGTLMGSAKVSKAQRPVPSQLVLPTLVSGKVTDVAGKPVAGTDVRAFRHEEEISTTTSREDGTYSLALRAEQEEETIDLAASVGDLGAWALGVPCPRGGRRETNLTLSNAVSIAGKVTAFDDSIIPGVLVQVVRAGGPPHREGSLRTPRLVATTSTSNGTPSYRFLNLRPGEYQVRIHVPDGQIDYHRGEMLRVAPGKTITADFQVAPFRKGRWRRYSTANGLPSSRVDDLQFTPDGALWLATQNGVSRFDGLKFTNFSKRDGLLDNRVFCIHPGRDGKLWFGTEEGACRFDPATGHFENFPGGTNGLTAGRVFDIEATPDGMLWLRTREGLTRFDGQSFREVPRVPRITLNPQLTKSKALAVDHQGRVWTVTQNQDLWRIDGTNIVQLTPADGLAGHNQDALHVALDGAIWFQEDDGYEGITRYDGQHFESLPAAEMDAESIVTAIHTTPGGTVWLGHRFGGATRYDPVSRSFVRFGEKSGAPWSWVLNIQTGPDGALWFATAAGVYRYEEETLVQYTKADGLPGDGVFLSTITRDGSLWFSSVNRTPFLARMEPAKSNHWEKRFVNAADEGFQGITVYGMEPDAKGLWLGGTPGGKGVFYYDSVARSGLEKPFREAPGLESLRTGFSLAFHLDAHNVLWVGKHNLGLYRVRLDAIGEGKAAIEKVEAVTNRVGIIYEDAKGAIWTAERYGGSPISRLSGKAVQYFSTETTDGGLPSNEVWSFQEDPEGNLYVGTAAGLARYDGKQFRTIEGTSDRPVPGGTVFSILRDREGVLWFASDGGLYRFDGVTWSSLDEEDGLGSLTVETVTQDCEGDYWLGTEKGLTRYRPGRQKPFPPQLIVKTDVEHSGTAQIPAISSGQLVGFRFNAVDFKTQPFRRFYRWAIVPGRVEGVPAKRDPAWREPTLATQFDWNPKAPGAYTFFVQFIDRDLNYSEPARAFLAIVTPWYASAWIMVPAGGGILGLIGWTFVARSLVIRRKREAEQLREQLLREEQTARQTLEQQVAETRKAEASMRESQELYHSLVENIPHIVVRKDLNGVYTFLNSMTEDWLGLRVLGVNQVGKTDFDLFPAPLAEQIREADRKVMETGEILEGEHTLVRDAGNAGPGTRYYHWVRVPLRDAAGKINGVQVICWDVTQAKAAEEELRRAKQAADVASAAKSQFLASMSHELRTPLTAIIGFSELLHAGAETDGRKEDAEDITRINDSATHLLDLINSILDLSKVEAGKMTLYLEEFDVDKMVGEVVATIQPLAAKKGNRLVVDCPKDVGAMRADLTKVRQVLFNLLSNANKFTDRGTIRLEVKRGFGPPSPQPSPPGEGVEGRPTSAEDCTQESAASRAHPLLGGEGRGEGGRSSLNPQLSTLNFSVSDTGIGMTPEQVSKLFEAFTQADAATSKKYGGTGLGLVISRKFCQLMGGDLSVESVLGQGSTFTVTLPAEGQEPKASPGAGATHEGARAVAGDGPTLLVIDDDPAVRALMERTLSKEGYRVHVAENGARGLELAKALKPSVITLDVMMAGMDGWAVLSSLKADPELMDIPVVMMTIVDDQKLGFTLGASEYLTKPIDWKRLTAVLRKYGDQSGTRRVLVVEDDASVRELLQRNLEKEGWTVALAENGRVALDRIEEATPALILLDLMMPEMDGFEFMEELHRRKECRDIAVIVVTSREVTEEDRRRLNGQVQGVIRKSAMTITELLVEMRTLMARMPVGCGQGPAPGKGTLPSAARDSRLDHPELP
jgi:PAS domain S-box-containing protein